MGSISVACYRPRPGCEKALLELVRNHLPPLRAQGLVTERTSIVARCGWNDRRDLRVGVAGSDCRRPPQSGSARFMEPVREGMHVRDSVELAGVPEHVRTLRADLVGHRVPGVRPSVGRAISRQPLSGAALSCRDERACLEAGCRLNSPPHIHISMS